jgi:hypothetical protein
LEAKMPKKNHKMGGKYRGSHTTYIDAASKVLRAMERMPEVEGIDLGHMMIRKSSGNGHQSVKVQQIGDGCLCLSVRGSRMVQEILFYTHHVDAVTCALLRIARDAGMRVISGPR